MIVSKSEKNVQSEWGPNLGHLAYRVSALTTELQQMYLWGCMDLVTIGMIMCSQTGA